MIKLLAGVYALSAFSSVPGNQFVKTETLSLNDLNVVDLSSISIDEVILDVSDQDQNISSDKLKQEIIAQAIFENKDVIEKYNILYNILVHPNDWVISNMPAKLPAKNTYSVDNIIFIPLNSDQYTGVLNFDVKLLNNDEWNINNHIKTTNLGEIVDNDYSKIIDRVCQINNISKDDSNNLRIISANYSMATIEGVNKWSGSVNVYYSSSISSSSFSWDSTLLSVRVYSTEDEKQKNQTVTYTTTFGIDNFKSYFSHISVDYYGYGYNSEDGEGYNNNYNYDIDLSKYGDNTLFSHSYSKSNTEEYDAKVNYSYDSNEITLDFKMHIYASASGWNAYWAEAKGQLIIHSIKFVH